MMNHYSNLFKVVFYDEDYKCRTETGIVVADTYREVVDYLEQYYGKGIESVYVEAFEDGPITLETAQELFRKIK